ncbi:MAG: single-stranded-DNA-specific exonuclease RecJ [Chloroflexi bacterium HGW-Chloroflexi-1]|nr:MAG: single-stranded-DNA-specific exonuclease RecJ [Chloroflexi bacterium HGW-Chloroflexi-1]
MPPTPKRWDFAPALPPRQRARLAHLHPLIVQILYNRGVSDPEEADAFLHGVGRFSDPFRMLGVRRAVDRIRAAIRAGERIVVYGDFDADGVTATALLVQVIAALGGEGVPYIPHRVDEGYGLNCDALDKVAADGARVVITVDCGIRSTDEVAYGNGLGLDMIVTDHHSIGPVLPPALAVINPKQPGDPYPFKDLAGVGIAFKLAQALLIAEQREPIAPAPVGLAERDLLDLVALGTVADLAPLIGENRALVQRGLAELNRPRRPGIQAMLEEAGLEPGRVDATAIGFVLGPRINAAGRLTTADHSYNLLTAPDALTAKGLAEYLSQLNRERQDRTRQLVDMAREHLVAQGPDRYLYLIADSRFEPGIVGLVAGRLTEELYRPTLVAEQGDDVTHGSARSIPEFNITAALDECSDLLVRHGGHAAAAGFTVHNEDLPALRARLEEIAARELADQDLQPSVGIDAVVNLNDLDWAVQEKLAQLEPCGYANPQPVLASLSVGLAVQRQVGADRRHLKLTVTDSETGQAWDAIAFRQGDWFGHLPPRIDLAYTLEVNEFNGRRSLQLNVKDIRPAQASRSW